MKQPHSFSPRANFIVALGVVVLLALAPQSGSSDAGPTGSLDRWSAPTSGPLVYSRARFSSFFGPQQSPATLGGRRSTGETVSPYQPIDGSYPGLLRYRGAGKQR